MEYFLKENECMRKYTLVNNCLTRNSSDELFKQQDKVTGLFDTEKELAYYCFNQRFYKMNFFSATRSSDVDHLSLYDLEGKKINSVELDSLIEKFFPEETKMIKKRVSAFNNVWLKKLINVGIMDYWNVKQDKILKSLPDEIKKEMEDIAEKSKMYISELGSDKKVKMKM